MTYTGHKQLNMHEDTTLVDWLTPIVKEESIHYGVDIPTAKQIAVVVSAMRMHTLIMHAANYDYSKLGDPDKVDDLWPIESSIGRYFRDAAQVTLDGGES